ncbi:MAG: T9SS type A sorting domain-containing protein [Saprospiraceae bacterium]|nr:T9SS type A sorting domain-containing protein [Candidatus Vicinibacter affinis]
MKKNYFVLFAFLLQVSLSFAQNRYLDPMFGVQRTPNVDYGKNIGIITGAPAPEDLKVDIYTPVGDTKTDRPLVLIAHTGSFLPPLYNGQITGSRSDSTVTATAAYLTSRGFVVGTYTHRLGWLPTSTDQNVRTSSLLQAAYRGIQDTRSCIRFFKKSVAEAGNPYGIDPSKICVWGIGTGGYLALGAGSLNDFGEVILDKFIDTKTLTPYIDSTILGNIYGTSQAAICLPNHPGYSSDFQLSVNMGGALGDSTWLDGEAVEPAYVGVHCQNDFFAPYYEGAVIVPTTGQFVIYATGTRKCIELANKYGSNDILKSVNADHDPLKDLIAAQKTNNIVLPLTMQSIIQGTDNFYGFDIPLIYNNAVVPQGSPWDWWDLNTLKAVVTAVNAARGTNFNADSLHLSGLRTNPDMSSAKARRYLDTIFALVMPRVCVALKLGCTYVGLKEVNEEEIGLVVLPNPARENMRFETSDKNPIESVYFYDMEGRLMKAHTNLNSNQVNIPRHNLNAGIYLAQVRTKDKVVTKQVVFQD